MFTQFAQNNRMIESGETKINLNQFTEIERKIVESNALAKFRPVNYEGSMHAFLCDAMQMMDNGYELDHDVIQKLQTDQIFIKGESIFDHPLFERIKDKILGDRILADKKESVAIKPKIEPKKELFKFSPIEMDYIKDIALKEERKRLLKLERLMELQLEP